MEEDHVFGVEERTFLTFRQVFARALQARVLRAQTNLMELGILFVESTESILGGATLNISSLMRIDGIGGRNSRTGFNSFTLDMVLWGGHVCGRKEN